MNSTIKNGLAAGAVLATVISTGWAVRHFHAPGQLDVVTAQAMDMTQMRPPTGAAPVALAAARTGSLANTVTYTGSVAAFNEADISARITGRLVSLPVYPGDAVQAGQMVAELDTAEVGAKAQEAAAAARDAQIGARVAHLTHHLHHGAALAQAHAEDAAAQNAVTDAQAQAQAADDAISDAQAGVQTAQANANYWNTELPRENGLADAGAVSRQEYESELSQAQAAQASVTQAQAKVRQMQASAMSARAKVQTARRQGQAADASMQMAQADIAIAEGQAAQAEADAAAADAAAREAAVVQGYGRITAPVAGVVTARPVAPGTLVQPGTVLARIAEIDRVRVQAHVAATDLEGVHVGSPVLITPQGSKPFAARVTSVFPSASDETRTATVEAVVPNPGYRLLPGGFVTMQITTGKASDALLVPTSAVVTQNGASWVWAAAGTANAAPVRYQCEKCHMIYSAADAKRDGYVDPMDGGRLLPVETGTSSAAAGLTAHEVRVQTGTSDGTWTQITSGGVQNGTQIVTHGQAGLTEGAALVASVWGADGPQTLPSAASAQRGAKLYRCEKCGMTYSAADAKRDGYIDPMDGGRLVPVESK